MKRRMRRTLNLIKGRIDMYRPWRDIKVVIAPAGAGGLYTITFNQVRKKPLLIDDVSTAQTGREGCPVYYLVVREMKKPNPDSYLYLKTVLPGRIDFFFW